MNVDTAVSRVRRVAGPFRVRRTEALKARKPLPHKRTTHRTVTAPDGRVLVDEWCFSWCGSPGPATARV